ncbi:MAG TPA: YeeE/YedE thiosulfate transporter family protein [Gammaproteobacteria bacterium]|nr:YeeE/YedE thiosulfate transporter family protein [Gammaproteobacteria bacterium]
MSPLVLALVLGLAFGALLEAAGLGRARKLVGQFYFTDLTVLKVLFSALVTAMIGAFWLDRLGVIDLRQVYIPETFVVPQALGGVLFGAGLVLAGLCPGTSCVAAATGRRDGLAVMAGLVLGIVVFNAAFVRIRGFHESTALGTVTLPEALHIGRGSAVALVTLMACGAFALAERLQTGSGQ